MAITKASLSAIQKAGALVHQLKVNLQSEAKKYSDRLSHALASHPDGNAFELLEGQEIAKWRTVGKLAKMIDAIESELSSAYKFASGLISGAAAQVAKEANAPRRKGKVSAAKPAKPAKVTKPAKVAKPQAPRAAGPREDNSVIMMRRLDAVLNADAFTVLKQSQLARDTGLPQGSIGAALRKLTSTGQIVLGKDGGYKLAKGTSAPIARPKKAAKKAQATPAPKASTAKAVIKRRASKAQKEAKPQPAVATEAVPTAVTTA